MRCQIVTSHYKKNIGQLTMNKPEQTHDDKEPTIIIAFGRVWVDGIEIDYETYIKDKL